MQKYIFIICTKYVLQFRVNGFHYFDQGVYSRPIIYIQNTLCATASTLNKPKKLTKYVELVSIKARLFSVWF